MKFALDTNHLEFFEKNQFIEFNALLTENEIKETQVHVEEALRKSVRTHKINGPLSADNQFMTGHDLWRQDLFIRKLATKKQWAELASQLVQTKTLRLGYDQLFPGISPASFSKSDSLYTHLTANNNSLVEISSIQEAACGLILCIKNPSMNSSTDPRISFPTTEGNGLFIHPHKAIQFNELMQSPEALYLLIAYVRDPAVYILNEKDPHMHFLKQLGYTFGDKLRDKTHPIVFR
jgi:hypothetical protein